MAQRVICNFYFAYGWGAKYCDEYVRLPVRAHNSKTRQAPATNFLCMLPVAVARSSSDSVAICYVLPVLWMPSCFDAMAIWRVKLMTSSHVTLSDIIWTDFISPELSGWVRWSDPVGRGCERPERSVRPTTFWLVAAMANWVASQHTPPLSSVNLDEVG